VKVLHVYIVLICTFIFGQAFAQDGVDIGIGQITVMDSLIVDDELPVEFYLKNFHTEDFDEDVNIRFNIADEFPNTFDNNSFLEEEDYDDVFIAAGDSVLFSKNVDIDDLDIYALTNDIIIIWPDRESINDTMPNNDVAFVTIFEDTTISSFNDNFALNHQIEIKQTADKIIVFAKEQLLKQTKLFYLNGQQVTAVNSKESSHQLNCNGVKKGIYIIEIVMENNKRYSKKIFINN